MCKLCDRLGQDRCPTHKLGVDLSARNAKVRASHKRNDPEAFAAHQRRAGRAGGKARFAQMVAELGYDGTIAKLQELGVEWQERNPSEPERAMIELLEQVGLKYQRERCIFGDGDYRRVDFFLNGQVQPPVVIKVAGYQYKESFGRDHDGWAELQAKLDEVRQLRYRPWLARWDERDQWAEQLNEVINTGAELPF